MKVGDLIRDVDVGDIGIVIETQRPHPRSGELLYHILFSNGSREWLFDTYIEVINESR